MNINNGGKQTVHIYDTYCLGIIY